MSARHFLSLLDFTTDELLATILEGTNTVRTCVIAKGWALEER